ncbi:MAG: hypothetical protein A2Z66_07750 [Chloroflexi bacterium RBG_13_66_10]|nr:MAG: hypothetical protein A2Z66_07750 [Chloroflexi bacterium RBG_13_66_10]
MSLSSVNLLVLVPLLAGSLLVGASALTTVYARRLGEAGGRALTFVLRNVLGLPLVFAGAIWAWQSPSPWLFAPNPPLAVAGWALVVAGALVFVVGHVHIGTPAGRPTLRDALVRRGLYAYVRHPIYAGSIALILGLAVLHPTATFISAAAVGTAWLLIQARIEERDLIQRLPEYRNYMQQVPRFVPHLGRQSRRAPGPRSQEGLAPGGTGETQ